MNVICVTPSRPNGLRAAGVVLLEALSTIDATLGVKHTWRALGRSCKPIVVASTDSAYEILEQATAHPDRRSPSKPTVRVLLCSNPARPKQDVTVTFEAMLSEAPSELELGARLLIDLGTAPAKAARCLMALVPLLRASHARVTPDREIAAEQENARIPEIGVLTFVSDKVFAEPEARPGVAISPLRGLGWTLRCALSERPSVVESLREALRAHPRRAAEVVAAPRRSDDDDDGTLELPFEGYGACGADLPFSPRSSVSPQFAAQMDASRAARAAMTSRDGETQAVAVGGAALRGEAATEEWRSLTLEQYAALCAEIQVDASQRGRAEARQGLRSAAEAAFVHEIFEQRFANDGALKNRWQTLVISYAAWLRAQRRAL